MVLLLTVLLTFSGLGSLLGNANNVEAAGVGNTVKVTLHKLQFDETPDVVKNTGSLMDIDKIWPGSKVLPGVKFDVYDMTAEYHAAYASAFTGNNAASAVDAAAAAIQGTAGVAPGSKTAVGSGVTDSNGEIQYDLPSKSGGKDAVYLFVESGTPANPTVTKIAENLVLALPVPQIEGPDLTDIHLYPKNETATSDMSIKKERHKYDHNIGERINYTITAEVPSNIDATYIDSGVTKPSYTFFKLIDTHSSQLTFDSVAGYTLKVVGTNPRELTEGVDYHITGNGPTGFNVELTTAGITELANEDSELVFEYKMYLNKDADLDTAYVNKAQVITDFHNEETPDVEVGSGGHRFVKKDSNSEKSIAGAEFIVRDADSPLAKFLRVDETTKEISWVSTFDEGATIFKSDANGIVEVKGLENGNYWLQETKAPDGYVLLKDRIKFEVYCGGETGDDKQGTWTSTTEVPSEILNVRKGFLPSTGGKGIYSVLAIGILSILVGGAYFFNKRKLA